MHKERNKRGKVTRSSYTQTIVAKPKKKDGKPNPHYPSQKTIIHGNTGKP